jgi:hypothetical protein
VADTALDSARLEWLVIGEGKRRAAYVSGGTNGWGVLACNDGLTFMSRGLPTFREAIDVAMAKYPTTSANPEAK